MAIFAIREVRPHLRAISTTRHISQDAARPPDERWESEGNTFSGNSAVVGGVPYMITIQLPPGFRLRHTPVNREQAAIANQAETANVRIIPAMTSELE